MKKDYSNKINLIRTNIASIEDILNKLESWANGGLNGFRTKKSAIMAAYKISHIADEINSALLDMEMDYSYDYSIPDYVVEEIISDIKGDYFGGYDLNIPEIKSYLENVEDDMDSNHGYSFEDNDDWNEWMDESEQHHTDEYPNYGGYTGLGNGHDGVEYVRGHHRRDYYRKDGTHVSAAEVRPHKRRY